MPATEVKLVQGSQAWLDHRAKYNNSSDAPAMMGVSKYKKRDQLLDEAVTGIYPEVDEATQRRFDDGHRFEALARDWVKENLNITFVPTVFINDGLSASLDGRDITKKRHFEHKSLNKDLVKFFNGYDKDLDQSKLDKQYRIQMEQQFMCNPKAEECLFMASKFDKNNVLLEKHYFWYTPDKALQAEIAAGWVQFGKDKKNHKPTIVAPPPIVTTIEPMPAISISVSAQVLDTNVDAVFKHHKTFISDIKPADKLVSDEDFGYGEKLLKFCAEFEKSCKEAENTALNQAASVHDFINKVREMGSSTRDIRLVYEKVIDKKKDSIKKAAIKKASDEYDTKLIEQETLLGIELSPHLAAPKFAEAIKNSKKIESMQSKINDCLAKAKSELTTVVAAITEKLNYLSTVDQSYQHLINEADLVHFDLDVIKLKVDAIKADEDKRIAERDEKAKADAVEELKTSQPSQETPDQGAKPSGINAVATTVVEQTPIQSNPPSKMAITMQVANANNVTTAVAEAWLYQIFGELNAA